MNVGSILPYTGSTVPDGFLECDGRAISRSDYSDLFEVIGTTFGAGDGSTTFNLPNLSGKVALGVGDGYAIGSEGGSETHSLISSELAEHSHEVPSHTHDNTIAASIAGMSHTVTQPVFTYAQCAGSLNSWNTAGGLGLAACYNTRSTVNMTNSTALTVADHDAADCTMSGGVTDCPEFDTESAGSSQAHNNMMPYLSLVYLIRYEPEIKAERMLIYNGLMPVAPSGTYLKGRKG